MKKVYIASLLAFLLFLTSAVLSAEASVPDGDIRTLLEQINASSDVTGIDEIIAGLRNAEGLLYKSGSKGNGVREFQNVLLSIGYTSVSKADGTYGSKTASAVKEFQAANKLPVTGEADLITQFFVVMRNSSFTRRGTAYIAQAENYAVVIWPSKAFYVGALDKSGNLSEGTYYYFSGGYYAGWYRNNKRFGKGTAHFANGDVYSGEWNNDAMNGYGTYYYGGIDSAKYYKGNMTNNMMNGKGTYYSGGSKITGKWFNNRRVK